jgi:hypothetical protein
MIEDDHNVVRYLRPTQVDQGVVDGSGFFRVGENEPSVNWIEAFPGSLSVRLENVRRVARLTYSPNGHLVQLPVGTTRDFVRRNDPNAVDLRFAEDPLEATEKYLADPSHALIIGMPDHRSPEAALLRDLLAKCVVAIHPAGRPK